MLNRRQKESIENEYALYVALGEVGSLGGVEYVLSVIGEHDFKDYLYETYRVQ